MSGDGLVPLIREGVNVTAADARMAIRADVGVRNDTFVRGHQVKESGAYVPELAARASPRVRFPEPSAAWYANVGIETRPVKEPLEAISSSRCRHSRRHRLVVRRDRT
jgi:hypothetical protein